MFLFSPYYIYIYIYTYTYLKREHFSKGAVTAFHGNGINLSLHTNSSKIFGYVPIHLLYAGGFVSPIKPFAANDCGKVRSLGHYPHCSLIAL